MRASVIAVVILAGSSAATAAAPMHRRLSFNVLQRLSRRATGKARLMMRGAKNEEDGIQFNPVQFI